MYISAYPYKVISVFHKLKEIQTIKHRKLLASLGTILI